MAFGMRKNGRLTGDERDYVFEEPEVQGPSAIDLGPITLDLLRGLVFVLMLFLFVAGFAVCAIGYDAMDVAPWDGIAMAIGAILMAVSLIYFCGKRP